MGSYRDTWVDVVEGREKYKDSFDIPTEEDLSQLGANDRVKISNGFERFFVRVGTVDGDTVVGTVMNHLVGKSDYNYQDEVSFEKRHIFMIQKPPTPDPGAARRRKLLRMLGEDADALAVILGKK